jgi:hypothetical protein
MEIVITIMGIGFILLDIAELKTSEKMKNFLE